MENEFLQKKRNLENNSTEKIISDSPKKNKLKVEEIKLKTEIIAPSSEISNRHQENDDISDIVFKYNINTGNIKCKLCQKEITNNIKFYCESCNYIFCINCFLLSKHDITHSYHIIDSLNFSLFMDNWSASEDHKLISYISKCGLNNWEEISKSIESKGQVECESYYYTFYYTNEKKLPNENNILLDENKSIKTAQLEENKKKYNEMILKVSSNRSMGVIEDEQINPKNNSRSICVAKNRGVGESVSEVLGARIKRGDFDNEFLNDIEVEISHLEFNENDKKKEKELQIKMEVLKDYNLILKEREKRKKFILDKNMMDIGRQNRIESRLSKEEYNLLLFMKPFHRFFENSEFYDLFGNIIIEQQLKLMLKNLNKLENEKNAKGGKISTIEELEKYYENDKGGSKSKKQGKINNHNNSIIAHHNNENHDQKDKENNNNIIINENNETNLLMNKMERYFEYEKITKDKSLNEIFDNDEFNLIKEMPLARSTFYDIKIKLKELISKFEDKNNTLSKNENLKESIKKLIDNYQLEIQTSSDIFDFYCKKYNDLILINEKELKIEEENKKIIEKNEINNNKELDKNEEENTKSTKHRGRNKKQKNKNDEEKQNKNNKEEQKDKDKDKDKNKEKNEDIEMNIK